VGCAPQNGDWKGGDKNMKKIIASLAMIALVGTFAIGATRAYFSDTVEISGETFSSGTITLNIGAHDTYYSNPTTVRTTVLANFENLKPGDTMRQWITLHNDGTLPIDYLTVEKQSVVDGGGLLDQIIVSAMGKIVGGSEDYAYFTSDWGIKPTVNSWFSPSDMLDVSFYRTPAGEILPGQDYSVIFDFSVPTTVGNTYQGQTASFDIVFYAEQAH